MRVDSCASFRWIGYVDLEISRVKKWKIFKIDDFLNKFIKGFVGKSSKIIDFHRVFQDFLIFHTRDLEIYITNPPETCTGVVPHALVCAKKVSADGVAPFMFKSTWKKKRHQKFPLFWPTLIILYIIHNFWFWSGFQ